MSVDQKLHDGQLAADSGGAMSIDEAADAIRLEGASRERVGLVGEQGDRATGVLTIASKSEISTSIVL